MLSMCARRSLLSPRWRSTHLVAMVLVALVLASVSVTADLVETPLCGEKHGFAGEFNDHFSIPIETAPAEGEAIVLVARTFPATVGLLLSQWLSLNATYHLPEGVQVSRQSDGDGILEIPRVAANTDIEVRVVRVHPESPVPFRFFSFFANRPVCHVAVSKDNVFFAPVPHRLAGTATPVTMYFKTTLPSSANAATIHVTEDGRNSQPFRVADKNGAWQNYTAEDMVQSSAGGTIAFAVSPHPDDSGSAYCFTAVAVTYGTVQGGTLAPPSSSEPRPGGGESTQAPATPPTHGGAATAPPAASSSSSSSASMSALRQLVWIGLFLFVVWQVANAVYNYRVLGKRDVMEIIPCAESVAAGARGLQLAAARGLGSTHRRSDGYDSVQSINDPYA